MRLIYSENSHILKILIQTIKGWKFYSTRERRGRHAGAWEREKCYLL